MIPALHGLNPKQIAAQRAWLREENRKYPMDRFVAVPRVDWGAAATQPGIREVWRSFGFLVQVYDDPHEMIRLTICRTACDRHGELVGGITWDELQRIKGQVGFSDCDAFEVYPADKDVINVANMRHLFLFKGAAMPFVWRKPN